MEALQFQKWRAKLELSSEKTAELLDLSVRSINNYETGQAEIPRSIELACLSIKLGIVRFDGKYAFSNNKMTEIDQEASKKMKKIVRKTAELLLSTKGK